MSKNVFKFYCERELLEYLKKQKVEKKFRTLSQTLRFIVKQERGLCLNDGCSAIAIIDGFCQYHCSIKSFIKEGIKNVN